MKNTTPGPWQVAFYQPTAEFKAIPWHVAVADKNMQVIALCGPDNSDQSKIDAHSIAQIPEMIAFLKLCASGLAADEEITETARAILGRL